MRMVLFQRTSASCASCARFHTKKIWKFGNTLNFKRTKQTKQNGKHAPPLVIFLDTAMPCKYPPAPANARGSAPGKKSSPTTLYYCYNGKRAEAGIWFLFFFFSFLSLSEGTFRCCLAPVFVLSLPCRFAVCQGISFSHRDKS